jgi:hypothetical protein
MSLSSHIKIIARKTKNPITQYRSKVAEGIYVAGTLAGWRSQLIAAGSGAAVATDILTLWNNGLQTHSR